VKRLRAGEQKTVEPNRRRVLHAELPGLRAIHRQHQPGVNRVEVLELQV
jgi:hypothetical protein